MSDLMPINAEIKAEVKADLTKPGEDITSMLKGTHKGLGKIYYALIEPWVTNRKAKADMIAAESAREIKLLEAQTAKDIHEINADMKEYRHGRLLDIKVTSSADYYSQVKNLNGICDAKRLEAAMLDAAIEINKIPEDEISDEPLNQTFFNHWRAEAELIDDEDLRQLWAKLLVEETCKPNSVSPRTLGVVKNLSRQDAVIFERLGKCFVGNAVIVNSKDHPLNGDYDDVLLLQDAGLIGQLSSRWFSAGMNNLTIIPLSDVKFLLVATCSMITFRCHILTPAGLQLFKFITKSNDIQYYQMIAREISKQNAGTCIRIMPTVLGRFQPNTPGIWNTDLDKGKTQK